MLLVFFGLGWSSLVLVGFVLGWSLLVLVLVGLGLSWLVLVLVGHVFLCFIPFLNTATIRVSYLLIIVDML